MSNETQSNLDVDMFAFRGSEMAGILEAAQLEPGLGSPLKGLSAAVDDSAREVANQAGHGVRAAASRIASPDRVVGVVTAAPPEPADFLWLYGAQSDLDFAYHQEDETGMHRLAWPVDGLAMLDLAAAPLDLDGPIEHYGVSLALGREEFSALVAIADFVQADALQGMLGHDPPLSDPPTFRIEDLVALAERATQSGDLRWMVPRARLMSPIELDFGEAVLGPAVGSLSESGLLLEAQGLFEVTPLLHRVCLLAGTCTGFSAISTRNREPETDAWSLDHFAISRGPGCLLLLEFEDVSATDFLVSIDDITPALAFEWLQGGLMFEDTPEEEIEEAVPEPTRTAAAREEEGAQRFCTQCGTSVGASKGFCTQCGEPMKGAGNHV
jgi:hypothetical protein